FSFFFCHNTATSVIYTLSLHDALPISSTLYFDSLTVNAGNGGFLHCIQMDTSVNAANQVVSVGADIDRCIHLNAMKKTTITSIKIGRAVQQECRDRSRMPSSA